MAGETVPASDLPENLVPASDLPEGLQSSNGFMSQLGSEVTRPFATTGKELVGGVQQAITGEAPGLIEQVLSTLLRGMVPGSQVSPEDLAPITSRLLGAGRALAAPVTGFVAEPAERATSGGLQMAGVPETYADIAGQIAGAGASMFAPSTFTNAIPKAFQMLGRGIMRPGALPVRAAEAAQASNIAANAVNKATFEEALAAHLQQRQALEAYQLQVEQAKQLSAAAQRERLTRISDKEQALLTATQRAAPTTTSEQAYSFMHQGLPMPSIPMTNLTQAAEEALGKLEGVPKSLQPTKVGKVAGELVGSSTTLPPGMTPQQQEAWEPILEQLKEAAGGGATTLDKVQQIQQGLGRLTRSTDPRVSGVARHLYANMMRDVEAAAQMMPEARQFWDATKIAGQNLAAENLADFMTNHGTRVTKTGEIQIQPEKLAQKLRNTTEDFPLAKTLRPEALADIQAALEDVFKVKSMPAIKPEDIITMTKPTVGKRPVPGKTLSEGFEPKRPMGILSRHPFVLGALAGGALGIPHGVGIVSALFVPRLIFRAAITPTGRKFIRALYAQTPPMVGDMARTGAMLNFLRSQGEDVDVPEEIQQGLQQFQQQQAAQQQQAQQAQQLQMLQMLMQQEGGKK